MDGVTRVVDQLRQVVALLEIQAKAAVDGGEAYETWESVAGQSKQFIYYSSASQAGKPSTSTGLVRFIIFKRGTETMLTQELTYNLDDTVASITAT